MFHPLRAWLIRILSDSEDKVDGQMPIPEPDFTKRATLKEIRDNHIHHLGLGVNQLHIRVGRLEAKVGLVLALLVAITAAALAPWIQSFSSAF